MKKSEAQVSTGVMNQEAVAALLQLETVMVAGNNSAPKTKQNEK